MKPATQQGSLRIIAGKWRSRKISFAQLEELRPTSNRIRETLFNWLQDRVGGANCLDLFAGSGACGIEALSRGASSVVFIDSHRQATKLIAQNLASLGEEIIDIRCTDAMAWLESSESVGSQQYGIVFIDPPYSAGLEISCCTQLEKSGKLKKEALVYLESDKQLDLAELPANWQTLKQKKAGAVNFYLFQRVDPGSFEKA